MSMRHNVTLPFSFHACINFRIWMGLSTSIKSPCCTNCKSASVSTPDSVKHFKTSKVWVQTAPKFWKILEFCFIAIFDARIRIADGWEFPCVLKTSISHRLLEWDRVVGLQCKQLMISLVCFMFCFYAAVDSYSEYFVNVFMPISYHILNIVHKLHFSFFFFM